ncbi:sugar transferase [Mycolicibacterium stellerae]|uniref:sugar transferase n=1 Tax=Mycolicibacterium stellerae TaxID=2358193 RepID=UPI000F0BD8A7|nr:sugar transferase [Mycolicibacterium stellerae]
MQLHTGVAVHPPSARPAVPGPNAATQPVREAPPRWVERVRTDPVYSLITVAVDVLYASAAVALAQWFSDAVGELAMWSWIFVPIVVAILATRTMYRERLNHRFLDDFEPVETSIALSALATLMVLLLVVPPPDPGETVESYLRPGELVLHIWVGAAILIPAVRLIRSMINRYLRRRFHVGSPVLIVGSGPVVNQLISRMRQVPDYGLWPAGVLDHVRPQDAELLDLPYLGSVDDLESAARATRAEELIIASTPLPDEQLAHTAQLARQLGLRVRVVPRLMDAVGAHARVEHLGGIPLMELCHVDPKGWQFAVKHALGRTIAGLGLLLISPLFLGLALLVKISSPGPVFFRQQRIGRDGVVFDCLKFRSMRPLDSAKAGFELQAGAAPGGVEGDDRRTGVGKFMRKTSLDELPQLLNVLRGDMALVGPRPERPEFVDLFEMRVRRYGERHRVKAGITGWAQVHGLRGQTSIADRAEFDNYYIENWSLILDLKILALTVLAVLKSAED